ncbi:transcriptional regulator [Euryarchaeota archaeon SM23-78]|nr:MAG: transcriptional regulator [Euryarchaeota archaeon SM23-78]
MENPICQSCGMPMKSEEDFGTELDGEKNSEYCHYCYKNGRFTDEGITMEDKIKKNVKIAKKMGVPEDKAREMANKIIPTLKRWQE